MKKLYIFKNGPVFWPTLYMLLTGRPWTVLEVIGRLAKSTGKTKKSYIVLPGGLHKSINNTNYHHTDNVCAEY